MRCYFKDELMLPALNGRVGRAGEGRGPLEGVVAAARPQQCGAGRSSGVVAGQLQAGARLHSKL